MISKDRKIAQQLAREYVRENKPLDWFEVLYEQAGFSPEVIPWADMEVNPNLKEWVEKKPLDFFKGKKILKVGCGLGDDSEYWTCFSSEVDAFDISPTAILWCHKRFPHSRVHYFQADLTQLDPVHYGRYDVVQESYTLQVLPPEIRTRAILQLPLLLKKGGILLIICRAREANDYPGDMPFPLTQSEFKPLSELMTVSDFEDYWDGEVPPVRRFRIEYVRI